MRLLIISGAPLISEGNQWKAYSPYMKEMILWQKYADEVQFCCPVWKTDRGLLAATIPFETMPPVVLEEFDVKSLKQGLKALKATLINLVIIFKVIKQADHIHLRCPGNIGLLACWVQILFPSKPKTAKYAGNWDPKAKQPLSYKLQKWILGNTFLTRNMQVLVYGEWEGSTKNIKPFFTATYFETDKLPLVTLDLKQKINFIFVGTLSKGKNPLYAIQLVEGLSQKGFDVILEMYGEGSERDLLGNYISTNKLEGIVSLKGNQTSEVIKKANQKSHFSILPSKSEGWPKAIAEAMFFGCVPVATPVSCVPFMLDHGNRGVLLNKNLTKDIEQLIAVLNNESDFAEKRQKASEWSRNYTLDVFENEIKKMLLP